MFTKKVRLPTLFGVVLVFSLACSTVPGAVKGLAPNGPGEAKVSTTGALRAQASSTVSVLLTWEPVSGATQYQLDAKYGEGEFLPVAQLASGEEVYEDFVFPGITDLTYRLTSAASSGSSEVGTATITFPPVQPNALTVQAERYQPTIAAMPTIDMENFDPNNFDPSSLIQTWSSSQEIGPEGGTLSVTSPDEVSFTLEVPAGAVEEATSFSLTPIESVSNLPLSGGLLGAVHIQPELVLGVPAMLTIDGIGGGQSSSAPLTVGFAVSPILEEFYLYPLADQTGRGQHPSGGGHLADLVAPSLQNGGSASMAVGRGGTYGVGAASNGDVRAQAERTPTDAGAQTAQHNAVQQVGGSGSGQSAAFRQTGEAIQNRFASADGWQAMGSMASALDQYAQDGGFKHNDELNGRLIDQFLKKLKPLLDRNKGDCLTLDDLFAQEVTGKMGNPKNEFWQLVAQAYRARYKSAGQKLLDDLAFGDKSCSIALEFTSSVKIDYNDKELGWWGAKVRTETPIPLKLYYLDGRHVLQSKGKGHVRYVSYEDKSGECPPTVVKQYPMVDIIVSRLLPVFREQKLYDFWLVALEFPGRDLAARVSSTQDKKGCTTSTNISGGGDLWSGVFALLSVDRGAIDGWKSSTGDLSTEGGNLVATTEVKDRTITVGEQTWTENAVYKLTIRRASKQ